MGDTGRHMGLFTGRMNGRAGGRFGGRMGGVMEKRVASESSYLPEAQQFFDRCPSAISDEYKQIINVLISDLISASIWEKLDVLHCYALNSADNAKVNLISSDSSATEVNSPNFISGNGFQGNGSSSYLRSGFTPATNGDKYTQNNSSLFVYEKTVSGLSTQSSFCAVARSGLIVNGIYAVSGTTYSGLNSQSVGAGNVNSAKLKMVTRDNSNTLNAIFDNASQTLNLPSTGLGPVEIFILAYNNSGPAALHSNALTSFFGAGSFISFAESQTLLSIFESFLSNAENI